jgi:hypothetical protein
MSKSPSNVLQMKIRLYLCLSAYEKKLPRLKPVGIGIRSMKITARISRITEITNTAKRLGMFLKIPMIPSRNSTRE